MSLHIQHTIAALEQELEVTELHCADLARAIKTLRPLAGVDGKNGNGASSKTNERTNERTNEQASRQRAARSLPDDAGYGESILAQLRKHGGVMKPGDLSGALKISPALLRARMAPLVKAKTILATGTTMSRRISLPDASAKEVP